MNMEISPTLKILVFYHKPAILFGDDTFIPFHCGRMMGNVTKTRDTISKEDFRWLKMNCLGDDTGDNISLKNLRYSELSGHYWAWKNYEKLGNPDYIGFMYYRRILVFSENTQMEPRTFVPFLTQDEYKQWLNPADLQLGKYDMYVPQWVPVYKFKVAVGSYVWATNPPGPPCKYKEKYTGGKGNIEMLEYIRKQYPEYYQTAIEYYEKKDNFQWNMFIFRKTLFFEYAQFLFDVTMHIEPEIYHPNFCSADQRTIGYLAEALTGIFIEKKKKENYKVKYLPMIHINDTTIPYELNPAFQERNIPICCAADNKNSYMCEVMIRSLLSHTSLEKNYDIVVLYDTLNDGRQKKILQLRENHPNISIRFYRVNRFVGRRNFRLPKGYSVTSLISLCVPEIFKNYEKVIYLEHDTIVQTDIAELYSTELENYWIAACQDNVISSWINSGRENLSYYTKQLGLKDPYLEYVSDSVVIWNVRAIRSAGMASEGLCLIEKEEYRSPARDALNRLCYDHIKMLSSIWNVCDPWVDSCYLPTTSYWQWVKDLDVAKVLSYRATVSKPWNSTGLTKASCWWRYARETPIYEELLTLNTISCTEATLKKVLAKSINQEEIKNCILRDIGVGQKKENMSRPTNSTLTEGNKHINEFVESSSMHDTACLAKYRKELRRLGWRALLSWGRKKQEYIEGRKKFKREIEKMTVSSK